MGRIAVRETDVSQHHGGIIVGPPESPRITTTTPRTQGFEGGPLFLPLYAERRSLGQGI